MQKVKIFVCCHKPDTVKYDDVYIPLHVGRAQSKYKEEMSWMIGDDTGDNISEKNPYYSEATGIYWIWKNVHDCEYVGLCHYRRFFDYDFTNENVESLFKDGTEVILKTIAPVFLQRAAFLICGIQIEDFVILRAVVRKLYPEYLETFDKVSNDYWTYLHNMVVCRKKLYDQYAEWLFNICSECEKYWKPSAYNNSKRTFAYISEFLTPIFFIHNHCKIKEIDVNVNGSKITHSPLIRAKYHILNFIQHIAKKNNRFWVDPSVIRGMKLDGIDLDLD